jgi:hypothetical protein
LVLHRELAHRLLGLEHVAFQTRVRRMRPAHLLGEEAGSSCSDP